MPSNRTSVPRDTRLLLTIVLIAVAVLWVLARIRFPDRPPTPNPVPPVLAQLAPPSALEDVVSTVAQLDTRLRPWVVPLNARPAAGTVGQTMTLAALRFRNDLAVVLKPSRSLLQTSLPDSHDVPEVGSDPPSTLAVVRLAGDASSAAPAEISAWVPRRLASPRFVIAADPADGGVSFRPVFLGSLIAGASAIWSGPIWILPPSADLSPGALVFNVDGAWAGVATEDGGRRAIVPAERVLAMADRLVREGQRARGQLGIEVQGLTPALSAATGAAAGVIVTWVDAQGPAAGVLAAGDTIDAVEGEPVAMLDEWMAQTARLSDQASVALRVHRRGEVLEVRLTARADVNAGRARPLGLTLRTVPQIGVAVVRVDSGSAASQAGLQAGDVLTLIDDLTAPTAAQALRAFAAVSPDRPILVGFTRGDAHRATALERTW